MPEQKRSLLIFCDPGLDDALALLWLLNAECFQIKGIVAVAGNTTAEQAFINLFTLTRLAGKSSIPLYNTLLLKQNYHLLPHVHGKNSLGDISFQLGKEGHLPANKAPAERLTEQVIEKLSLMPGYQILSLGPLTVVAHFLKKSLNQPEAVMIMGGLEKEPGNYNNSEFNFGLNREAAAFTTQYEKSGIAVAPLDLTRQFSLEENFLKRLSGANQASRAFRELGETYLALAHKRGNAQAYPHDLTAAVAMTKPAMFRWCKGLLKMNGQTLELGPGKKDAIVDSLAISSSKWS